MKKSSVVLILLFFIALKNVNAQKNEIYIKSALVQFSNDKKDNSLTENLDETIINRKNTDIVLGYTRINKKSIQYSLGVRVINSSSEIIRNVDNKDIKIQSKQHSANGSLGIEAGIGKRIKYKKILFIPSANFNFHHSTYIESEEVMRINNKFNNTKSHSIKESAGGNSFLIGVTISQGIFYPLGKHWKVGGELNALIGFDRFYGKGIQITRDVINNTIPGQSITRVNNNTFFSSTGIQLSIRYTL